MTSDFIYHSVWSMRGDACIPAMCNPCSLTCFRDISLASVEPSPLSCRGFFNISTIPIVLIIFKFVLLGSRLLANDSPSSLYFLHFGISSPAALHFLRVRLWECEALPFRLWIVFRCRLSAVWLRSTAEESAIGHDTRFTIWSPWC